MALVSGHGVSTSALVSWDGAGAQNHQPRAPEDRGRRSAPAQGSFALQSPGWAAGGRRPDPAVSFRLYSTRSSEDKEGSGPFDGLPGVR